MELGFSIRTSVLIVYGGYMAEIKYIKSPLNYTGGKGRLIEQLEPLFGNDISVFVDLFSGSGTVGVNVRADKYYYNDISEQVTGLLYMFSSLDYAEIISKVEGLIIKYNLSNTYKYGYSYYQADSSKGMAEYNKDNYMRLRKDFNELKVKDIKYYLMLFVLIIYGFNNQIRFNSKGEYNMPVGKRDFNANIRGKLSDFAVAFQAQDKVILNNSFECFDVSLLDSKSLVYCDPPYLISTATYNEQNGWTESDEVMLLDFLDKLNSMGIRFALSNIIKHKNRENTLLINWVRNGGYHMHKLNYNYSNASYHGKDTQAQTQEVLITNYTVMV